MIRTIDTDLLCGVENICAVADVLPAAVSNWQVRHGDFPMPLYTNNKRVKVWYWPEVASWLYQHGKLQ